MPSPLDELLPTLKRLDALLERAIATARTVYGPETATDRFRGLYISHEDAERLLVRAPGEPLFRATGAETAAPEATKPPPSVVDGAAAPEPEAGEADPAAQEQPAPGFFSTISRWLGSAPEAETSPPASDPPAPDAPAPPAVEAPATKERQKEEVTLPPGAASPQMVWLQNTFGLSVFDMDVLLVALAPELDARYQRIYAYLQDDVSRRRPSVDLILNLLCTSADDRLQRRAHFTPQAPLLHHNLIHLVPDRDEADVPLLSHYVKLDGQIARFLLQQQTLDPRLAPFCRLLRADVDIEELALPAATREALPRLVADAWEEKRPLHLYFHGAAGSLRRLTAEALANEVAAPLLVMDVEQALSADRDFGWLPPLLLREAWLQGALLYLDGMDALADAAQQPARERLLQALSADAGVTMMGGSEPWVPSTRTATGVVSTPFPIPDLEQRQALWRSNLQAADVDLDDDALILLGSRFRLTPTQIAEATAMALQRARWRAAAAAREDSQPTLDDLFFAARAQTGHDLAALAPRIEPIFRWPDIVLPDDTRAQLREIVQRVDQRHRVLHEWGFASKLSRGKGINALFAGPSGTGKTMAAEILAHELGLDLYKIDLSGVVSKYIGETEKNLDRIFRAAEDANAILFFDEADALFGKRSEVRDSHDRYANIEISYLLQKMEEHDGITILATNLRQNLDDAFVRRLAFTVHFPFPDEEARLRIWEGIWPAATRLGADVDLGFLAREFRLSGGNIRNVALAAAFMAAADGSPVTTEHLLQAIRREYQKMGKTLSEEELQAHRERLYGMEPVVA